VTSTPHRPVTRPRLASSDQPVDPRQVEISQLSEQQWDQFTAISRAFSPVVGEVAAEVQLDPEEKEARWIRIT
jgi:hypothetical protein